MPRPDRAMHAPFASIGTNTVSLGSSGSTGTPEETRTPNLPAIEATALVKRFGDIAGARRARPARPGRTVHGLVGPNGAGKTTLLRVLFGLIDWTAAPSASWAREVPASAAGRSRASPASSRNPASTRTCPRGGTSSCSPAWTAVTRGARRRGARGRAPVRSERRQGRRVLVGDAAATRASPRRSCGRRGCCLLDEPTVGLDPTGAREMRDLVRRLAADGTTVLMSSHDMNELDGLCDSVTVMRSGRSVWEGSMERLRAEAPAPAHRMWTSDDSQAAELARSDPGVKALPDPDGWLTVEAEPRRPRRVRDRAGTGGGRRSPAGAADDGARIVVLRTHRSRGEDESMSPSSCRRPPSVDVSAVAEPVAARPEPVRRSGGVSAVYRVELAKVSAQLLPRLTAVVCLLGPFVFALVMRTQTSTPADTLFGRWITSSGFAIPFVVLGFAGIAGFPLLASIVAGDIFASEDRLSTWKTVLTRSCYARGLFAGKTLAAATFTVAIVTLLAVSSIAAGVVRRRHAAADRPLRRSPVPEPRVRACSLRPGRSR